MQAQAKRQNRSHALAVRSWLAVWLQHRRRKRAGGGIPAPVITGTNWQNSAVDTGFLDAYIQFTFDQGDLPAGNLEVWERDSALGDHTVATLPINQRSFWHYSAINQPINLHYRVRYVNGPDVAGPFSNEVLVQPYDTPALPLILSSDYVWGGHEEGFADVTLNFSFNLGTLPNSTLEVWYRVGESGDYTLLDTVSCDAGVFFQGYAASNETVLMYKMRYVYGEIVGPFSEEFTVYIGL